MTKDHQEDCFVKAIKTTGITGFAGLFVSALQNSMQKHSHGAKGVFTRTGGTITLFAAVGGVFSLTECALGGAEPKQPWHSAVAGCAAGSIIGLKAHSFPLLCGACAALGGTMFFYQATGANWQKRLPRGPDEAGKIRQERRERFLSPVPGTVSEGRE